MKPDQPCQKQVSPPFSGEGLAQSYFLFFFFPPLSFCLSLSVRSTVRDLHVSIHLALDLFLTPLFIVSWHSDFTTTVVVFLTHFPLSLSLTHSLSCPTSISHLCLSTHTFSYLISAFQIPCLALGSHTSFFVVLFGTKFSLVHRVQSDIVTKRRAQCQLACYLFPHYVIISVSDQLMELMCFP